MKKKTLFALCMCASLAVGMSTGAAAEENTEAVMEETEETEASEETAETEASDETAEAQAEESNETAEAADDLQIAAPADFNYDPNTGEYSFTAVDDRAAYYFVRVYKVEDGKETGEYVASSKRINGNKTGEVSGTVDLSGISWGMYHVNLTTFVPAGTDYIKPDTQTIAVQYGVDCTLERPEMMILTSGNQAEIIVDWYTLSNYAIYEYLPYMEFKFYSDAECTQEVFSDTVDLSTLPDAAEYIPPAAAYAWGANRSGGEHIYTLTIEATEQSAQQNIEFEFKNDVFTYSLDPGTYYVTCQGIARDEYVKDSQVSTAVEITLTEGESTSAYEKAASELWADPVYGMERVYAGGGAQPDRIDLAEQSVSGVLLEE